MLASGLEASKVWIKESIALQRQLVASVIATRGPIAPMEFTPIVDFGDDVAEAVEGVVTAEIGEAVKIALKADRNAAIDAAVAKATAELAGSADAPGAFAGREREIKEAVNKLVKKLVRKRIVDEGVHRRPRRRRSAPVSSAPSAHRPRFGTAQRGETQVLNVTTLAMRMNQLLDTNSETQKRYPPPQHGAVGQRRDRRSVRRCRESATERSPPVR